MKDVLKSDNKWRTKYRRIELLLSTPIADALDNYRASKRPIPNEADAIRWLMREALETEGFPVKE